MATDQRRRRKRTITAFPKSRATMHANESVASYDTRTHKTDKIPAAASPAAGKVKDKEKEKEKEKEREREKEKEKAKEKDKDKAKEKPAKGDKDKTKPTKKSSKSRHT